MLLLRRFRRSLSTAVSEAAAKGPGEPKPKYDGLTAIRMVLKGAQEKPRKFDEAVDIQFSLSVDPKKPLQQVRAMVTLPHGSGKDKKVAAFVHDDESRAIAEEMGVAVGDPDAVVEGNIDFQAAVATAEALPLIQKKCAKVLGPRSLMPNVKLGTVADSPGALRELLEKVKSGPVVLKTEPKFGLLHASFGKVSMGEEKLTENLKTLLIALQAAKPEKAPKNQKFVLKAAMSTTMGKSVRVDPPTIDPANPRFLREPSMTTFRGVGDIASATADDAPESTDDDEASSEEEESKDSS